MLKVTDFWYQYLIATNRDDNDKPVFTVGIVTMDGADLAYSKDFASMTEAVAFRTSVYATMQTGTPLSSALGVLPEDLPSEISDYDDKRVVWYVQRTH